MGLKSIFEDNVMLSAIKGKRGKAATIAGLLLILSGCTTEAPHKYEDAETRIKAKMKKAQEAEAEKQQRVLIRAFGKLLTAKESEELGDTTRVPFIELDLGIRVYENTYGVSRYSFFEELEKIAQAQGDTATAKWIRGRYLDKALSQ